MPTVNVYYANDQHYKQLKEAVQPLKELVAQELACGNIQLQPYEVSIRFIKTEGDGMLADVELEVTAHAFEDRVKKQDKICLNIRTFLKSKTSAQEIRVWLILTELGHSWE